MGLPRMENVFVFGEMKQPTELVKVPTRVCGQCRFYSLLCRLYGLCRFLRDLINLKNMSVDIPNICNLDCTYEF